MRGSAVMGVSVPLPPTFGCQGGDRCVYLVYGERRDVRSDWLLPKACVMPLVLQ